MPHTVLQNPPPNILGTFSRGSTQLRGTPGVVAQLTGGSVVCWGVLGVPPWLGAAAQGADLARSSVPPGSAMHGRAEAEDAREHFVHRCQP